MWRPLAVEGWATEDSPERPIDHEAGGVSPQCSRPSRAHRPKGTAKVEPMERTIASVPAHSRPPDPYALETAAPDPRAPSFDRETAVTDKILHATDADFDAIVLQSDQPVLVDFWAPWCMPCKAISPLLEQLAEEYDGRAKIVKVDVEAHPAVGRRYGVRNIPLLLMFKSGQVQDTLIGSVGKSHLAQMLDKTL
jgi:thioredoxin 1